MNCIIYNPKFLFLFHHRLMQGGKHGREEKEKKEKGQKGW